MPVRKRGGVWWYDFQIKGVRYRGPIRAARTKEKAKEAENKVRESVFDGTYGRAQIGTRLLSEFIDEVYMPWAKANKRSWQNQDQYTWPVLKEYFEGRELREVTPLLVEKFKVDRLKTETIHETARKPASVNRELEVLSRIFTLAIDQGEAASNPCSKVKKLPERNKRMRYLLDDEETRLFAQFEGARSHLAPMVTVAIGTGMRRGDHFNLQVGRVDFQRNCIWVPNSKTGQDYPVPMSEEVRKVMLENCRSKAMDEYVFLNPKTGKPYTDLKRAFQAACDDAGISGLNWHDLRHTFGMRLGEAGANAFEIMELMGHTSAETSRRYVHPSSERKRAAVAGLLHRARHNSVTKEKSHLKAVAINS